MDGESFISPVVDLFREVLYDILGLFVPGAALLLILRTSSFQSIQSLVSPMTGFESNTKLALFLGASYVLGYAVQGFAGRIWGLVVVNIVRKLQKTWKRYKPRVTNWVLQKLGKTPKQTPVEVAPAAQPAETGMQGISPAFLQVKDQLESSELFRSLRTQAGTYCGVSDPSKLTANEVQNLAYSIADERASNAFTFAFRGDLSVGMFFVFAVGAVERLLEYGRVQPKVWFLTWFVFAVLAFGFALRAWTYLDIRGRIIYPIGLAVLADHRRETDAAKAEAKTLDP